MSTNSQMSVNKPKRIDLSMFWGPLVMIAVGVILSVIVGLAEIFYFKYRGRVSGAEIFLKKTSRPKDFFNLKSFQIL